MGESTQKVDVRIKCTLGSDVAPVDIDAFLDGLGEKVLRKSSTLRSTSGPLSRRPIPSIAMHVNCANLADAVEIVVAYHEWADQHAGAQRSTVTIIEQSSELQERQKMTKRSARASEQ